MSQFFWGILKMFSTCHIFIRTYNSWPRKFAAVKKLLVASPTKILEIPDAIGGNAPLPTDQTPMENSASRTILLL